MRANTLIAGAIAAALAAPAFAQTATNQTPQSAITGGGGVQAPSKTHDPVARTSGGHAVTAPSGQDPRSRSRRCNLEANKRHLTASARQEFRLSCLATAAPAPHAGTETRLPKTTHALDSLGSATPAQPH